MLGVLQVLLAIAFFAAGAMIAFAQRRYISRYQQVHHVEVWPSRVNEAPWLFFAEYGRIMRAYSNAYRTKQADAELERLRLASQRWQ